MSYLSKSMLWAGAGLLSLGMFASTTQAKEPVKTGVAVSQDVNGHYETRVEFETQRDENGVERQVRVERRVWVDDEIRVGVNLNLNTGVRSDGTFSFFGARLGEPVDSYHKYHDYDRRNGSNYQNRFRYGPSEDEMRNQNYTVYRTHYHNY